MVLLVTSSDGLNETVVEVEAEVEAEVGAHMSALFCSLAQTFH